MPDQQLIFKQINSAISVSRPRVVAAKEFVLHEAKMAKFISIRECLQKFLTSVGAQSPKDVVIHPSIDPSQAIHDVAENISWQLAFCESIWSLIHNGLLLPMSNLVFEEEPHIQWTTITSGGGGYSAGWNFPGWKYSLPEHLRIAPSFEEGTQELLVDPDLYLKNLGIDGLHKDVLEALQDAVRCFRVELYTPCLAMLAKATEGAWVELGLALVMTLSEAQQEKVKKLSENIESEFSSIAKKVSAVLELYERQDLFRDLSKQSNVRLDDLRNAAMWADCVRESRNVVHYGNKPSFPNNFEKVAALLLGAPSHFRLVYRLIATAKANQVQ